jgi:hypothetical protein
LVKYKIIQRIIVHYSEKLKQIYDEFSKESKEWHEKYDKSAD